MSLLVYFLSSEFNRIVKRSLLFDSLFKSILHWTDFYPCLWILNFYVHNVLAIYPLAFFNYVSGARYMLRVSPTKREDSLKNRTVLGMHLVVRFQSWKCYECGVTPSLSLLSGTIWLGVVLPVRVPSMGQIDLLRNYSYLIGLCAKEYTS